MRRSTVRSRRGATGWSSSEAGSPMPRQLNLWPIRNRAPPAPDGANWSQDPRQSRRRGCGCRLLTAVGTRRQRCNGAGHHRPAWRLPKTPHFRIRLLVTARRVCYCPPRTPTNGHQSIPLEGEGRSSGRAPSTSVMEQAGAATAGHVAGSPSPEPILVARDIHRSYGPRRALQSLSFSLSPGRVLGFLGPNGAGKTTAIRVLTTILEPTSGTFEVDGISSKQPDRIRHLIGVLP
ncbi:MAG: ATP-binding cassette domain-containing protein, partial [Chloroflexota bacterium]